MVAPTPPIPIAHLRHHQPLLQTILKHSTRWHRCFNGAQLVKTVCPRPDHSHVLPLHVPSKLSVLHYILTATDGGGSARECVRRTLLGTAAERVDTPHFAELVRRLDRIVTTKPPGGTPCGEDMQWFHENAHELLLRLTDAEMMSMIAEIDDARVHRALRQWRLFPGLYDYFVPLNVQHQYERRLHCASLHQWEWLGRTYELTIFAPPPPLQRETPDTTQQLHMICYRITMMSLLDKNNCQRVRFKWFPSDCVKEVVDARRCCSRTHHELCRRREWNPYQINTGATRRNTCNTATIWRTEEAGKTFVHEMMHSYGWDFDPPDTHIHHWVHAHFSVDPAIEIRFFEGYVETWATMLNVYMTVAYNTTRSRTRRRTSTACKRARRSGTTRRTSLRRQRALMVHIQKLLHTEKEFVLFQVAKVLVHSGFDSWEDFFLDAQRTSTTRFQQLTNVFNYFIVRSAHLWDIEWFIRTFRRPDFSRSGVSISKWLDHLLVIFRSASYQSGVNQRMRWIRDHTTAHPRADHRVVLNTMRMTCVESVG